jgi:hypothetical protein
MYDGPTMNGSPSSRNIKQKPSIFKANKQQKHVLIMSVSLIMGGYENNNITYMDIARGVICHPLSAGYLVSSPVGGLSCIIPLILLS